MNRIRFIYVGLAIGTLCINMCQASASSSSSSSSSSHASSSSSGSLITSTVSGSGDVDKKEVACKPSKTPKLTIMRELFVPGDQGKYFIKMHIDLLQEDHISKEKFLHAICQDHKQNLAWPLIEMEYVQSDGSAAVAFGDARFWFNFLGVDPSRKRHPLYNGLFLANPKYYAVTVKNKKFAIEFLGTHKEAVSTKKGEILRLMFAREQNEQVWMRIGEVYFEKKSWNKAIEWYDKARVKLTKEEKNCAHVLTKLGFCYSEEEDWDKAIDCYQIVLSKLEEEGRPCGNILDRLGYCYANKKEIDIAIKSYYKALIKLKEEAQPHREILRYEVLIDLGHCYKDKQMWNKAIECYQEVLKELELAEKEKNNRCCIHALYALGVAYERTGDICNAYVSYKKSFQYAPASQSCIDLIYLAATQQEKLHIETAHAIMYAESFLSKVNQKNNEVIQKYQNQDPARYAVALAEARRLCAVNASSDESSATSSLPA